MVIYMGQMTPETSRMVGSISGNLFPFLLPILFTAFIAKKHKVRFNNKNLHIVLFITLLWSIAIIIKQHLFSSQELSYYFFLFYALIVAYVHVQAYGYRFFSLYEDVMVFMCKIVTVLWLVSVITPGHLSQIFYQFPQTGFGRNFLYLFNWMDPMKGQVISNIQRNAGFSWEPGRFAISVILAITVNLLRNGIKFKGNRNVLWLFVALVSTMSTTGYSIMMTIFTLFWFKKFSIRKLFSFIIIAIPIGIFIFSLEFMGEKLEVRADMDTRVYDIMKSVDYANSQKKSEYEVSLDRFESIYFEAIYNIPNDPILGYGRNVLHSYYSENISTVFTLTGGLLKILGQYGVPLGLLIYCILFKSSMTIANESKQRKRFAIAIVVLMASISYILFCIPIFTTFWMYGLYIKSSQI